MPGTHLTSFERGQIEALHARSVSKQDIARQLQRHPATIGRELRRNGIGASYQGAHAQRRYQERRTECRPKHRLAHAPLRTYVKEKIGNEEWSPEQVAHRLPIDFPDDPRMRISHEALYQALYREPSLHYLIAMLAQGRPKRRPRGQTRHGRAPAIPNRVGIEHRPAHIQTRAEHGHWEADTIVGKNQDGFIVTLVERHSRRLLAIWTSTKQAAEVARAAINALREMPRSWVKTITADNGTEFYYHELITHAVGAPCYFAAPYASYQRGTNENTNGLIRRYLPKGTPFASLTQRQVDCIVDQINNRPRKCLGYRTPNEVFHLQRQSLRIALQS